MVLQELGGKLTAALQKMQSVTVISEEVLDKMLKDIAAEQRQMEETESAGPPATTQISHCLA